MRQLLNDIRTVPFSVDYARSERLQFEDDEYYYYVKAIPKVAVTTPEDGEKDQ